MRKYLALAFIQILVLTGCGGGGGGGSSPPPPPMSACAAATNSNVEPIIVDQGPTALMNAGFTAVNVAFVTVRVCVPGSASYQLVDHIQVDTQSSGLRILASAIPNITLPAAVDSSNNPMAECVAFADGSSWGSLATADIQLPSSGEKATGVTVQIIGDPAYEAARPPTADCPTPTEDTVANFGANGILGVGPAKYDCGDACIPGAGVPLPIYYGCATTSSCVAENVPLTAQLVNTATLFTTDNNGVIVELNALTTPATGQANDTGSLLFGIGTETNNVLGAGVTVLEAQTTGANCGPQANGSCFGYVTASLNGTSYPDSYIDSGSNGNFFGPPPTITQCGAAQMGFYCPVNPSTLSFSTTLTGTNNVPTPQMFSVGNAADLFNATTFAAFSNIGGINGDPQSLDLGLPFFYGQNVYVAVEGATVGTNTGPFYAF